MNRLTIYEADGKMSGPVSMSSPASTFSAVRVPRSEIDQFSEDLSRRGVYMLLIGTGTVYVGQCALDTIYKRVQNTHAGTIDATWHTLVAFPCKDSTISSNELLYIENAMCEYVYSHYPHCATTTPVKANCNSHYRNTHYSLTSSAIHSCNQHIRDIEFYISKFVPSIFMSSSQHVVPYTPPVDEGNWKVFYFRSPARDTDGRARILIHQGHTQKRKAVLLKGSRVSAYISDAFTSSPSIKEHRRKCEEEGIIVDRVLQQDIVFASQSAAGQFLNGASFDGNSNWKTVDGDVMLKELLE